MMLSIILFGLAAVGGLVMALFRFSGHPTPPLGIAAIHGIAAALGLITLIIGVTSGSAAQGAALALGLFLLAALGGFTLLFQHLKRGKISIPILVVHAAVAVAAFVVLLMNA